MEDSWRCRNSAGGDANRRASCAVADHMTIRSCLLLFGYKAFESCHVLVALGLLLISMYRFCIRMQDLQEREWVLVSKLLRLNIVVSALWHNRADMSASKMFGFFPLSHWYRFLTVKIGHGGPNLSCIAEAFCPEWPPSLHLQES